jgi:Leishmanolysin
MLKKFILVLAFVCTIILLMGGSCGGSTPEPQPKAQLANVSSTSLSLTAQVGASTTSSFTFENTGDAALTYTLSETADFLAITSSPSGTVQPSDTATVTLEASCTAEGTLNSTVSLTSNGGNAAVAVALTCTTPPSASYDVSVQFYGASLPNAAKTAVNDAISQWKTIIQSEITDLNLNDIGISGPFCSKSGEPDVSGQTIDDLLVLVTADTNSDGPGGGLAAAGPGLIVNSPESFTRIGCVFVDPADANDPQITAIIVHELGHVFGIGTLWETNPQLGNPALIDFSPANGCSSGTFSTLPSYTGSKASEQYDILGGSGNIPVEEEGGEGTQCGHWNEQTFDNELMTGFLNADRDNPLSAMSVASLEDLGYEVDLSRAEDYNLPSLLLPSAQTNVRTDWETVLPPKIVVDIDGKVIYKNNNYFNE